MPRALFYCLFVFLAAWPQTAFAEKRVALVIGNGAYENAPRLPNPTRDAEAIANLLRTRAGFQVVQARNDLKSQDFMLALREFKKVANEAEIALVYYAGHAIQLRDKNYMIAVDATLDDEDDAVYYNQAVPLDLILQTLDGVKRLRVVILDACRDNPFVHKVHVRGLTPPQAGLARVNNSALINDEHGGDTLIVYATAAGFVAEDGDGDHSPFAEALLKHLAEPGLDIRRMFGKVRDDVRLNTKRAQNPFVLGTLGGDEIALVPAAAMPQTQAAPEFKSEEDELLGRVQRWEQALKEQALKDAEAKRKTDEQRAQQEAEAKRRAEAEQAAEAKRKTDDQRARLAAEAKRKAEEAAQAAEAKRKAEEARSAPLRPNARRKKRNRLQRPGAGRRLSRRRRRSARLTNSAHSRRRRPNARPKLSRRRRRSARPTSSAHSRRRRPNARPKLSRRRTRQRLYLPCRQSSRAPRPLPIPRP